MSYSLSKLDRKIEGQFPSPCSCWPDEYICEFGKEIYALCAVIYVMEALPNVFPYRPIIISFAVLSLEWSHNLLH